MAQQQPARLIDILAENTKLENLDCHECEGHGVQRVYDAETGSEEIPCEPCQGSGYNPLGMILHGILSPPSEGWDAEKLQEVLKSLPPDAAAFVENPQALPQPGRNNVVAIGSGLDSLAQRRYELLREKDRIQQELNRIDDELKDRLQEGEVAYGDSGIGYRLSVARQDIYDQSVIQELDHLGLLPWVSKISTSRLKELTQQGLLSWEQFHALQGMAEAREIRALREVVNPEARVI